MCRKIMAVLTVSAMAASMAGCSGKKSSSTSSSSSESSTTSSSEADPEEDTTEIKIPVTTVPATEASTVPPTEHISPRETLTASCGTQVTVNKTIPYTEGSNTVKIPLADLI